MPRKASRVSRRQAHLLLFRVIPALLAAAALVAASLAGWAFLAGSAVVAGSTLTGCPNGDAGLVYTPITGITVDANTLVAGYGCGMGPAQVYKYAVLVTYENEAGPESYAAYSGVYDCYTNAIFSNLQPDDAGSLSFSLQVYAFNQASYPTALDNLAFADDAGAVEQVASAANWSPCASRSSRSAASPRPEPPTPTPARPTPEPSWSTRTASSCPRAEPSRAEGSPRPGCPVTTR
jgi:hypothetical protein